MKIPQKAIQTFLGCAMLMLFSCAACGQKHLAHVTGAAGPVLPSDPAGSSYQVQLKLVDGSTISVDEAWESEQGIWYRRSGMSHLIARDRIKAIERDSNPQPKPGLRLADVVVGNAAGNSSNDTNKQRVWIYLVGGAFVEVDSATESAAGVWYTRGSLSAFVER